MNTHYRAHLKQIKNIFESHLKYFWSMFQEHEKKYFRCALIMIQICFKNALYMYSKNQLRAFFIILLFN
jgi:hypothetical protein